MRLINIGVILILIGCGSSEIDHFSKVEPSTVSEDQYLGGELPSWVNESGHQGEFLVAVGSVEGEISTPQYLLIERAEYQAKIKLLQNAPIDYESKIVRAVSPYSERDKYASIYKTKTSISAVEGIIVDQKHSICRKVVRDLGLFNEVKRVCFVRAYIKRSDLRKAIALSKEE